MSISEEKYKDVCEEVRLLQVQVANLQGLKMKTFNDDECWVWDMSGYNHIESLVCPIVIYPSQLQEILAELVDEVTSDVGVGYYTTDRRNELIARVKSFGN